MKGARLASCGWFARLRDLLAAGGDATGTAPRVADLVVLAGPSAVGKTHLLETLAADPSGELAADLRLSKDGGPPWTAVNHGRLHQHGDAHFPRLLLHHDTLRSHCAEATSAWARRLASLLADADRVRVLTLVVPRGVLIHRMQARPSPTDARARRRVSRLLGLYGRRAALRSHYARWEQFCARAGARTVFLDATDTSPQPLPGGLGEALQLLG